MADKTAEDKEVVHFYKQGYIGIITLNRPEAMNTLNGALCSRLIAVIEEIERDDDIRVAVITGAGGKAFCAGIDLRERKGMSDEAVGTLRKFLIFPLYQKLAEMNKPLIGAINGLALGGGAEIALLCDIRIASENAGFGQTEIKWAIIPGAGACQRLPAIVGVGLAKELLLTGKVINAGEGERAGLYNHVTTSQDLLSRAIEMAQMIAENGPVAVRQIKKAINLGTENHLAIALDREASEICYHTQDRLEGLAAFNEKRKPIFQGK